MEMYLLKSHLQLFYFFLQKKLELDADLSMVLKCSFEKSIFTGTLISTCHSDSDAMKSKNGRGVKGGDFFIIRIPYLDFRGAD